MEIEKKRNAFTFSETSKNEGIVSKLKEEAKKEGRSLNDWLGILFKKIFTGEK